MTFSGRFGHLIKLLANRFFRTSTFIGTCAQLLFQRGMCTIPMQPSFQRRLHATRVQPPLNGGCLHSHATPL